MEVISHSNVYDVVAVAKSALRDAVMRTKEMPLLLLFSGGSALTLLHPELADALGSHVTIGTLDERYSHDAAVQNFTQLTQTDFYSVAKKRGCAFINATPKENESLGACADRFEASLRAWREQNPRGRVVITQGIGADGHTAGILPFPEDSTFFTEHFDNPSRWVVGYETTPEKNPHRQRITTTLPFLRSVVDATIVYAVGREKKHALQATLAREGSLPATPARILHTMRHVSLFTDYHAP